MELPELVFELQCQQYLLNTQEDFFKTCNIVHIYSKPDVRNFYKEVKTCLSKVIQKSFKLMQFFLFHYFSFDLLKNILYNPLSSVFF